MTILKFEVLLGICVRAQWSTESTEKNDEAIKAVMLWVRDLFLVHWQTCSLHEFIISAVTVSIIRLCY